jgi:predicted nucleic acid-binding protein
MNITHLSQDLATMAGEIAYEGKVTFYDPLLVAIAEHKKEVCITADEETQYKKLHPKDYPIELL